MKKGLLVLSLLSSVYIALGMHADVVVRPLETAGEGPGARHEGGRDESGRILKSQRLESTDRGPVAAPSTLSGHAAGEGHETNQPTNPTEPVTTVAQVPGAGDIENDTQLAAIKRVFDADGRRGWFGRFMNRGRDNKSLNNQKFDDTVKGRVDLIVKEFNDEVVLKESDPVRNSIMSNGELKASYERLSKIVRTQKGIIEEQFKKPTTFATKKLIIEALVKLAKAERELVKLVRTQREILQRHQRQMQEAERLKQEEQKRVEETKRQQEEQRNQKEAQEARQFIDTLKTKNYNPALTRSVLDYNGERVYVDRDGKVHGISHDAFKQALTQARTDAGLSEEEISARWEDAAKQMKQHDAEQAAKAKDRERADQGGWGYR